jgi:PKHD-type hydroxylase
MQEDTSIEISEEDNSLVRENLMGNHVIARPSVYFESIIPDYVLEIIRKRISDIPDDQWKPGQIGDAKGGTTDLESRNCEVAWITELDWVSSIFTHYFRIANRECWEYDIVEFDALQVTRYGKGQYYNWHADYGSSYDKNLTRKLSATLVISDPEEYTGGKLQMIDYHGKIMSPNKKKGSIIIFDSRCPHRVTPVLKGERISLVAWMLGPKLR